MVSIDTQDDVSILPNRLTCATGADLEMRSEWCRTDGRPCVTAGVPVTG